MRKGALEIRIEEEGDVAVAFMFGVVEMNSAESVKPEVGPLCAPPGAKIAVECKYLAYVNSARRPPFPINRSMSVLFHA